MSNLNTLNEKRASLNDSVDGYTTITTGVSTGEFTEEQRIQDLADTQQEASNYGKLVANVKKDDPNVTSDDQLFSDPTSMTKTLRKNISDIIRTGKPINLPMRMVVNTEGNVSADRSIKMPFGPGSDVTIDWGDGNVDVASEAITHTYAYAGIYELTITGTINGWSAVPDYDRKWVDVEQWGGVKFLSIDNTFNRRLGFSISAKDSPTFLANATAIKLFYAAREFNDPIGHWDVSNLVDMTRMICGTYVFNQPLNDWDVSNVQGMAVMFSDARAFNRPLDKWNTGNVVNMANMFTNTYTFDQDLSGWNVNNVTTYYGFDQGSVLSTAHLPNFN